MKNTIKCFLLFLLLLSTIETSFCQIISITRDRSRNYVITYIDQGSNNLFKGIYVPGNLINPLVRAKVKAIKGNNYKYIFKVKNKKNSKAGLFRFVIKSPVKMEDLFSKKYNWYERYIALQTAAKWTYLDEQDYGLPPSKSEIFSFKSQGLPSIGLGNASNLSGISFKKEKEELPGYVEKALDSLRNVSGQVIFQTIVPYSLPEKISTETLLDTLTSYLKQSCTDLAWITNRGICRSLQAKLDNVGKQLSKDKFKQAINGLRAFLNEVQAQKGKHLSSEAYALLYFNGKFLKGKLEEQAGGK